MPSEEEAAAMITANSAFKKEDPSQFYEIIRRIGVGGFAKVFEVKRKSDGYICALKFIEPKGETER